MNNNIKSAFADKISHFKLPRYNEIPNVGLYLEQVVKFVNGCIVPLGCPEITPSMISNYVKGGIISAPIKKQYYAEQIAYLVFVGIGKSVLSMNSIEQLFVMQKKVYNAETAYNYFCLELENMLAVVCGMKEAPEVIGVTDTEEKYMLRDVIIAVAHLLYVNYCLGARKNEDIEQAKNPNT